MEGEMQIGEKSDSCITTQRLVFFVPSYATRICISIGKRRQLTHTYPLESPSGLAYRPAPHQESTPAKDAQASRTQKDRHKRTGSRTGASRRHRRKTARSYTRTNKGPLGVCLEPDRSPLGCKRAHTQGYQRREAARLRSWKPPEIRVDLGEDI